MSNFFQARSLLDPASFQTDKLSDRSPARVEAIARVAATIHVWCFPTWKLHFNEGSIRLGDDDSRHSAVLFFDRANHFIRAAGLPATTDDVIAFGVCLVAEPRILAHQARTLLRLNFGHRYLDPESPSHRRYFLAPGKEHVPYDIALLGDGPCHVRFSADSPPESFPEPDPARVEEIKAAISRGRGRD